MTNVDGDTQRRRERNKNRNSQRQGKELRPNQRHREKAIGIQGEEQRPRERDTPGGRQTYKNHKKPRGRTRDLGDIRKSETPRLPPAHRWISAPIQSLCNETETQSDGDPSGVAVGSQESPRHPGGGRNGACGRLGRGQGTAQRMPPPLHPASGVGVRTCVCVCVCVCVLETE